MAKKKAAEVPAAAPTSAAGLIAQGSRYPWAYNVVKLNRAIAHVQQTAPELKKGTPEHEAAVKERYIAMNGLVIGDKKTPSAKRGEVVNMADDDGSDDDDEEDAA